MEEGRQKGREGRERNGGRGGGRERRGEGKRKEGDIERLYSSIYFKCVIECSVLLNVVQSTTKINKIK